MPVFRNVFSFIISKGVVNEYRFQIKQNGLAVPMAIEAGDTFNASLYLLSDDSLAFSKPLTVVDATNGEVTLTITSAEADALYEEHSPWSADHFHPEAVYRLFIDCNTVNNGPMSINIPHVFVD